MAVVASRPMPTWPGPVVEASGSGHSTVGPAGTRELILDAAERLFAAHGLEGVAVRDLARETGLTPSSLYNHFPGKQALYDAVLERGLRPVVEMAAEAWQEAAFDATQLRARVDRLVSHLARHPDIAPLLQRAMLADGSGLQAMILPWFRSLQREGAAIVRRSAGGSGWQPDEIPHLMLGLFGLIYGYFINAAAVQRLAPWTNDPFSPAQLETQRRFLAEAIERMLGPRPRAAMAADSPRSRVNEKGAHR